jgi:hypothetical protein
MICAAIDTGITLNCVSSSTLYFKYLGSGMPPSFVLRSPARVAPFVLTRLTILDIISMKQRAPMNISAFHLLQAPKLRREKVP